jgi:hypothetical protein
LRDIEFFWKITLQVSSFYSVSDPSMTGACCVSKLISDLAHYACTGV